MSTPLPISRSNIADLMSEAADDQLSLVLTDWERLLEVGVDLTTSHSDCIAINALFGKRVVNLQPTVLVTSSTAISRNLQRLGKLRQRLVKIGIDGVTDSRLIAICEQLIQLKTASHPALAQVPTMQGLEKSELLRLKDLQQWAATRLAVHSSFPDAKCALERLDKVTAYELSQLKPRIVDSDDSTFLKALELSARIRKSVSCAQYHLIDRVIASKIDALQRSRAVTFSQSTSSGETSSSEPEKAKNQNCEKTHASKEQVIILQSKLEGLEATIRTLKHDKKVMAEDKVALTRGYENLALALKTIEDERVGLQKSLLQEREAYRSLQSASQEQKSLPLDVEKLKAEMSQLSTASGTSGGMAKVLGELLGKFRGEQIRLEDGIKCISDKLEHAEGTCTALATNANKLAAENAHMKAELAKLHENLAQTTISPSTHRAQASGPDPTVQFLMAERARLERELAKAHCTLSTIHSSLSSYPMASPTHPNAPDTTGKVESQRNGILQQVMDYSGTTNSQGPDATTLAPSTATDANDWSFVTPERIPSPSGSVESEL